MTAVAPLLAGLAATVLEVLVWLIFIRALLSWFRPPGYHRTYYDVMRALERLTEPVLAPIRERLRPERYGMIDFSPFVAIVLIELVKRLLVRLIYDVF